MFKNLASDALGLSDIGKIIKPEDYDKTDIDDYVFNEDNETIFVVIKSKSDEYCFTNMAFIHLDGASAMSKKKTMRRYPFQHYIIKDVRLETAGTVDLDAEIKFKISDKEFSIDIDKKQIEQIKQLYKALFAISQRYIDIQKDLDNLYHTHEAICKMFTLRHLPEQVVLSLPDLISQTSDQVALHYKKHQDEIKDYDFSSIFQRYLG